MTLYHLASFAAFLATYASVRLAYWHRVWLYYRDRNEAALADSGMRPGGSMTFRQFMFGRMARLNRCIYGARYDARRAKL